MTIKEIERRFGLTRTVIWMVEDDNKLLGLISGELVRFFGNAWDYSQACTWMKAGNEYRLEIRVPLRLWTGFTRRFDDAKFRVISIQTGVA